MKKQVMKWKQLISLLVLVGMLLSACTLPQQSASGDGNALTGSAEGEQDKAQVAETQPVETAIPTELPPTATNTAEPTATATTEPTITPTPEPTMPTAFGPYDFPPGINPLTGLPVENPENLSVPPAMISLTNWPITARPQAGLSYSPIVFELYIGEGMSRFLAMFYGDYPQAAVDENKGNEGFGGNPAANPVDDAIGPVRSGRLPYESLRQQYNGFLIMASAFKGVAQNLGSHTNVFGSDEDDVNSAMISVDKVEDIAKANEKELGGAALSGMRFDVQPPTGGQTANSFWYIYNSMDIINWLYDPESGGYKRFQDEADGTTFVEATDRLNGDALTYENIIVLFADHRQCTETAFDVDLMYVNRAPALLFRDGQMYKLYWTTKSEEYERETGFLRPIRFIDENGDPFPFKPGQTWIHITPLYTPYWEAVNSNTLYSLLNTEEPGSGNWVMRFYASMIRFDQAVCDQLRN